MRTMISKWSTLLAVCVFVGLAAMAHGVASADRCDDCKDKCQKAQDGCKRAAPKALCKVPGVKGVCTMFKNAQCPAAGKICRSVNCGLIPGCDPAPRGGGGQVSGDPHFYSLDSARFDLQAAGEFIIARSKAADVEIQARFAPISKTATVVKVIAIKSAGHVMVFALGEGLVVDQQSVAVLDDGVLVDKSVSISAPKKGKYLVTAGETEIWVHVTSYYLNLYIGPAAASKSTWEGLLGDFDGNPKNDFRSRDGKELDRDQMSRKEFYGTFGASWRVSQAESLLPYESGETTATFTDLDFPATHFEITDLDEDAFTKARLACLGRGVLHGEALRNCIYDLGVTGSVEYAEGYAEPVWLADAAEALIFKGTFAMRAQSAAHQGEFVPVFWSLGSADDGKVVVRDNDGKVMSTTRTRDENPVLVRMPAEVGVYQVEFSEADRVISRQIDVTEAKASITAPPTVGGAEEFEFTWTGPLGRGDFVAFTEVGESNPNKHLDYVWANREGKGTFQAPATPGQYEVRYVLQGASERSVLAKQTISVTKAIASIVPPAPVEVGARILIEWQGPDGRGDYIDLTTVGDTKTRGQLSYGWTREGKTVKLRAPAVSGKYVVRYIADTASGRAILATAPITVNETDPKLTVPASVAPGSKFNVSWTGPERDGDYLSVAKQGETDPRAHLSYDWANAKGSAMLKAPTEPGSYDVLYVVQGSDNRRILGRRTIKVEAAK